MDNSLIAQYRGQFVTTWRFFRTRLELVARLVFVGGPLTLGAFRVWQSWPYPPGASDLTLLLISALILLLFRIVQQQSYVRCIALIAGASEFLVLVGLELLQRTHHIIWGLLAGGGTLALTSYTLYWLGQIALLRLAQRRVVTTPSKQFTNVTTTVDPAEMARDYLTTLYQDPKTFLAAGAKPGEFHEAFRLLMNRMDPQQRVKLGQLARQRNQAFLRALRKRKTISPDDQGN